MSSLRMVLPSTPSEFRLFLIGLGGSIRITKNETQKKVFEVLKINEDTYKKNLVSYWKLLNMEFLHMVELQLD